MSRLLIRTVLLLGSLLTLWCEGRRDAWVLSEPTSMEVGKYPGERPIRKRTYRRACARALKLGGTWYRNSWITSPLRASPPEPLAWQPLQRKTPLRGKRLRIFSWNARSLTQELWHELQCYAQQQNLDILMLQSTCWTFNSTWVAHGYNVIHSGSTDEPNGGVLIMVSTKLCKSHDISYSDPLPGRMLHVRAKMAQSSLDLLTVYQHPWRSTLSPDQNLEAREPIWTQLHESLTHLPFRNRLLLGGTSIHHF